MTPNTRVTTLTAVAPRMLLSCTATSNRASVSNIVATTTPTITNNSTGSPWASAETTMAPPIAPGPAMIGVARGTTDRLCIPFASCASKNDIENAPPRRAKIMSRAISIRIRPPAALRAARETPSWRRIGSPRTAKNTRMTVAIRIAFAATMRRSRGTMRGVRVANRIADSSGPTVATIVEKAISAVSSIYPVRPPGFSPGQRTVAHAGPGARGRGAGPPLCFSGVAISIRTAGKLTPLAPRSESTASPSNLIELFGRAR